MEKLARLVRYMPLIKRLAVAAVIFPPFVAMTSLSNDTPVVEVPVVKPAPIQEAPCTVKTSKSLQAQQSKNK